MSIPRVACIGIIGKADNPLHTSLFPPYQNTTIDFSFLLNSCLDIFEIRQKQTSVDQDLGLLHAVDERLAVYGWLTTTGVKILVVIDFLGRLAPVTSEDKKLHSDSNIKESDIKPIFRALQKAYIQLLQNPFYSPDDHAPATQAGTPVPSSVRIANQKFIAEVKRIGDSWAPGVTSL